MKEDIYRHVGRRIREERQRRGWTQEELAERADVHLSFVGQIERGIKKPSLKTLKALADSFSLKAGDLLDESGPEEPSYSWEKKLAHLIGERPAGEQKVLYETLRQLMRQTRKLSKK